MPVVHSCEISSLTSREVCKLRVFENKVLRRICSVLLTNYHSGVKIKKTGMGKACSTLVERIDAYRVSVGNPEGRRPLGRPRLRGRIILKGIFEKWDGCVDWIDLA